MVRKQKDPTTSVQIAAPLWLQIGTCVAATLVFASSLFIAWLAFEPYSSLLVFLSTWKIVGTIAGLLSAIAAAWAFVLGWDAKTKLLEKIYAWVFAPMMRRSRWLWGILVTCAALLGAQAALAAHLLQRMPQEPESTFFGEYDAADKLLKALPATDTRKLFFIAFNDILLNEQKRSSASGDSNACETDIRVLRTHLPALQPLYQRYLRHRAEAACLRVAKSPKLALEELEKMLGISRFLDADQRARALLAKAFLYFQELPVALGLRDGKESRQMALNVLTQIELPPDGTQAQLVIRVTKLRMQGNVSFQDGDYGEANRYWAEGIGLLPDGVAGPHQQFFLEKVRLHTNRVLSLGHAGLKSDAYREVRDAEPTIGKLNFPDFDSHRTAAVRLYSNASLIAALGSECSMAKQWWGRRESIKQQTRSVCTALLETAVLSCGQDAEILPAADRRQILNNWVFAVTEKTDGEVPTNKRDLDQLLSASVTRFKKCYVGLTYPRDQLAKALGL